MNCSLIQELLQDYLENTIDALEKIFVEEHLKVCKECRRELTTLKLLFWELDEISDIDIPREVLTVKENVLRRLVDVESPSNMKASFSLKDFIAVQNNIIDNSTLFLKFLPGARITIEKSKSSSKKASSLLENFVVDRLKIRSKNLLLRGIL